MKKKILITDDDTFVQRVLARCLSSRGYEVVSALTGDEALELARQEAPDLILLDVGLPGKNGEEVFRELKMDKATRAIPVVFATGNGAVDASGAGFLSKPFSVDQLISQVEIALGRT